MMAKKNNIKYGRMLYLPGSGVRANAMINGRIHATVVDTERKNKLLSIAGSTFKVLSLPNIQATDEALYAHKSFLKTHKDELQVLVKELLHVWDNVNTNPAYILEQRNEYGLLSNLSDAEISLYFEEMVAERAFPSDGGITSAFTADLDFYGFAGTIIDPAKQKVGQYWDFSILEQAIDPFK